jgi:DNA-binding XRE family transcriptional regulator
MISNNIQKFLELKMKENQLSKKELSEKIDISYPMTNELLHANKPQPVINTVFKIAKAFNTSIDIVLNRSKKKVLLLTIYLPKKLLLI